jgi:hypothetical protein
MAEIIEYGLPLVRFFTWIALGVFGFFIWEGFREYRLNPLLREQFTFESAMVDNQRFRWTRTIILACLFIIGLGSAYFLTLWGASLSHSYQMSVSSFCVWFLLLAFSMGLMLIGISQFLNVSSLTGYWIAWWVSAAIPKAQLAGVTEEVISNNSSPKRFMAPSFAKFAKEYDIYPGPEKSIPND